jgi:hypothetical protein
MSVGESLPYRSPISKLLRFFCRSRDKWKARCKEAKRENKSLKYRLAVMTESRDRWKAEARGVRKRTAEETQQTGEESSKNRTGRACRGRRGRAAQPVVVAERRS